jgi:Lon protease-like protein
MSDRTAEPIEPAEPGELPMFPLGTVVFPGMAMPLHVFEPRYRALTERCLAGDREFGIVLIERGSEVGGGDTRFSVGTRVRIAEAASLADGRWLLAVVGVARLRVSEWLPDDPYPRALVVGLDDEPPDGEGDAAVRAEEVAQLLRRALAMKTELGDPAAPATTEIAGDLLVASYQLAALAPVGPVDHQRLLAADTIADRLALLRLLLLDELDVLARRACGR